MWLLNVDGVSTHSSVCISITGHRDEQPDVDGLTAVFGTLGDYWVSPTTLTLRPLGAPAPQPAAAGTGTAALPSAAVR